MDGFTVEAPIFNKFFSFVFEHKHTGGLPLFFKYEENCWKRYLFDLFLSRVEGGHDLIIDYIIYQST